MSEASEIIARAENLAAERANNRPRIDYARMQANRARQLSALTRAVKSGDAERIAIVCRDAVRLWNDCGGAWPDDWSRWQRALDDSRPWSAPRIDLNDLA